MITLSVNLVIAGAMLCALAGAVTTLALCLFLMRSRPVMPDRRTSFEYFHNPQRNTHA